jgi:hypothetical protein
MLITREKYNIAIMAPSDMDLHNTKMVSNYIQAHIAGEVRNCIQNFTNDHGNPMVVRLASSDFQSLKDAITEEDGVGYISSSDLKIDGVRVKATCQSGRGPVVLDSEYDDETEEEE